MLGASGLGKHQAHFVIVAVKNQYRQDILIHNSIDMRNYAISTVGAYVDYRMKQLQRGQASCGGVLVFHTPFTVKYQGAFNSGSSYGTGDCINPSQTLYVGLL